MARAITMRHSMVPPAGRAEFRERARRSLAHYTGAGCHYWVFEEATRPGAYVEFFEAGDTDTLLGAHERAPARPAPGDRDADTDRLYVEVELT